MKRPEIRILVAPCLFLLLLGRSEIIDSEARELGCSVPSLQLLTWDWLCPFFLPISASSRMSVFMRPGPSWCPFSCSLVYNPCFYPPSSQCVEFTKASFLGESPPPIGFHKGLLQMENPELELGGGVCENSPPYLVCVSAICLPACVFVCLYLCMCKQERADSLHFVSFQCHAIPSAYCLVAPSTRRVSSSTDEVCKISFPVINDDICSQESVQKVVGS